MNHTIFNLDDEKYTPPNNVTELKMLQLLRGSHAECCLDVDKRYKYAR